MGRQDRKFGWQTALGALAISWGIVGAIEAPASAAPWTQRTIAQVGVRSQIGSPTPLNLRPRTHIPLPTNSRSRDYYGYPTRRYYGHGKYGHYRDPHRHYPPKRSGGGTVIIINPSNYSEYSNYNYSEFGGRVRVIRK